MNLFTPSRLTTLLFVVTSMTACTSAPQRGMGAPVEDRHAGNPRKAPSIPTAPRQETYDPRIAAPTPKTKSIARAAPAIRPRSARPVESPRDRTGTTAIASLLKKAQSSPSSNAAAATLERALRIEPNNPMVWNRLAAVRLDQGRPKQAEALAMKSNALAAARPTLWPENWRIIAQARGALGDTQGAAEAEAKRRSGAR